MADAYSVYKGSVQIPIKANSLTFSSYMGVKKSSQVIVGGQFDSISSEDLEKSKQKVEFEVPLFYQDVDMRPYLRGLFKNGQPLILRNEENGDLTSYKSPAITDNGETKDDGERYMKITVEGTEATA